MGIVDRVQVHMSTSLKTFFLALIWFHFSEVILVIFYEPKSLSSRSLLLSPPYCLAMAFSMLEYYVTTHLFFSSTKSFLLQFSYWPGLIGIACGELLRKSAWLTARTSFSHDVRTRRQHGHKLVTTGIYAWCRHPAYLGWFIWAASTQLLLANPVSCILFSITAWTFFRQRIPYEEFFLLQFFGLQYSRYREKTPTRIPGIP